MNNILKKYKNKHIPKSLAVSLVIKFALQEGILYSFVEEIKKIKPYEKGNDDTKFVVNYAVGLAISLGGGSLSELFLLPHQNYRFTSAELEDFPYIAENRDKWGKINNKWFGLVDELVVKPLHFP